MNRFVLPVLALLLATPALAELRTELDIAQAYVDQCVAAMNDEIANYGRQIYA